MSLGLDDGCVVWVKRYQMGKGEWRARELQWAALYAMQSINLLFICELGTVWKLHNF
jgi:hypothetical protein